MPLKFNLSTCIGGKSKTTHKARKSAGSITRAASSGKLMTKSVWMNAVQPPLGHDDALKSPVPISLKAREKVSTE